MDGGAGTGPMTSSSSKFGGEPVRQNPGAAQYSEGAEVIEVNNDPIEEDEFVAQSWDGNTGSSTSITSSVYAHTFENGRRYHAYKHGRYPVPNDDIEQGREDTKHVLMLELTDGKLFHAPIDPNPQKILDIGTGTGQWAIETADLYPMASVIGVDLSPIQPPWVPPNVRFIVDDIEDEWMSGSNWDFIHFRSMAIVLRDIQKVVDNCFKNMRPGGWIEFQESHGMPFCDDLTMRQDDGQNADIMKKYYQTLAAAMAKFGYDVDCVPRLGEVLTRAGFVDVRCVRKKYPLGPWAKGPKMRLVGMYAKEAAMASLASASKLFAAMGIDEVERQVWVAKIRAELEHAQVHRYYQYYFWYAQKPEVSDETKNGLK